MENLSHRQLFLNNLAQTTDFPLLLEIEFAEGIFLFDKEGKKCMDLISGIGVSNVGHRHPRIVEAIKNQVDKYLHLMVYGEFVQSPQVEAAKKILSTLPSNLNNIYFTNSGSEAVEGAMKLAKRYTGRSEIISFDNAYHGSTQGSLSVSGSENFKNAFRPLLPAIKKINFNSFDNLSAITHQTAAVIIETIQGEAGIKLPENNFLKQLRDICSEKGALLILDEIQTGFGRTGKFWAFEHYNIIPDILLCAKGMGGGMPIGAFIANQEVMGSLKNNPILGHITTFGGHPVSCAACSATVDVIKNDKLMEDVGQKEILFKKLLVHPKIKNVRGKGLMLAVEFENFEILKPIIDKAIIKGVLTDWFLYCDNAMRISPPLIITDGQIKEACEIILSCID